MGSLGTMPTQTCSVMQLGLSSDEHFALIHCRYTMNLGEREYEA
jgi:hypothetical protein